jgi:hypothetical protein
MKNLKDYLYDTIHRNKKTVEQLADETGISDNYLYRACLPVNDKKSKSGVKFPIEHLVPLMKAANDFSILKYIAQICGFLLVKLPVFTGKPAIDMELLSQYQQCTARAIGAMLEFFKSPSPGNFEKVSNALHDVMIKSVEAKKYCEKTTNAQIEMEF